MAVGVDGGFAAATDQCGRRKHGHEQGNEKLHRDSPEGASVSTATPAGRRMRFFDYRDTGIRGQHPVVGINSPLQLASATAAAANLAHRNGNREAQFRPGQIRADIRKGGVSHGAVGPRHPPDVIDKKLRTRGRPPLRSGARPRASPNEFTQLGRLLRGADVPARFLDLGLAAHEARADDGRHH